MKFITDAQLPKSLTEFITSKGYDSIHTFDLPKKNLTGDKEIIEISKKENRILLTKDNDFLESYLINKQPSKLVLIKTGNINNFELLEIFETHLETILKMLQEGSLVEVNKDEIVLHV